jgi:hypothetical protein
LQGIFEQDFPHMDMFTECMLRDLAGNSFSASVPIVAMLSLWATCPDVFEDPTPVTIYHLSMIDYISQKLRTYAHRVACAIFASGFQASMGS